MAQDASQQAPPPVPPPCPGVPRIRDPPIFTGADGTDVEDWLALYERVSVPNKWDDDGKLTNLVFYLAGVASLWYNNHASDFATWSDFKTAVINVFGRPAVRKLQAEQRLRERAQKTEDNTTMSRYSGLLVPLIFTIVILLISAVDVNAVLALNYGSQKAKEFWESQGRADVTSKLES